MELKVKKRKIIGSKETHSSETTDAAAMMEYIEQYPLLRPFLSLLLEYNAVKVFTTTFLAAKVSKDGRMRTQYRVAGTKFGRLASTKNVMGEGANFQNFPQEGKLPLIYALEFLGAEVDESLEEENYLEQLTNLITSETNDD
jgi:DNA polymerase I-like protein with 3'-5' exonuclease and polymerase domains